MSKNAQALVAAQEIAAAVSASSVVASGTTHTDPGSAVTVAFAGDHTALSDADFLHHVQRSYRVVQLSNPDPSGFAATPFLISAADASAGAIDVKCIAASIPFEVVVAASTAG